MSTRAQRRERAQARRRTDPIADRMAAREAIHAQYLTATTEAFEEASRITREAYAECDRTVAAAWSERARKMRELEELEIPAAELGLELEEHPGTDRLVSELGGQAEEAGPEDCDVCQTTGGCRCNEDNR